MLGGNVLGQHDMTASSDGFQSHYVGSSDLSAFFDVDFKVDYMITAPAGNVVSFAYVEGDWTAACSWDILSPQGQWVLHTKESEFDYVTREVNPVFFSVNYGADRGSTAVFVPATAGIVKITQQPADVWQPATTALVNPYSLSSLHDAITTLVRGVAIILADVGVLEGLAATPGSLVEDAQTILGILEQEGQGGGGLLGGQHPEVLLPSGDGTSHEGFRQLEDALSVLRRLSQVNKPFGSIGGTPPNWNQDGPPVIQVVGCVAADALLPIEVKVENEITSNINSPVTMFRAVQDVVVEGQLVNTDPDSGGTAYFPNPFTCELQATADPTGNYGNVTINVNFINSLGQPSTDSMVDSVDGICEETARE